MVVHSIYKQIGTFFRSALIKRYKIQCILVKLDNLFLLFLLNAIPKDLHICLVFIKAHVNFKKG